MGTDFQLGEWLVRPQRDCLERGGRITHVKPKSMAVLVRLAQAAGEAVTRNELFDAVWPGGAVTDDVLTQCIVELRKAFGDSARNPRIIETIPKVGFRLLPMMTPLSSLDEPTTGLARESPDRGAGGPWQPATRMFFFIASTVLMALVFFWYLSGSRDVPRTADSVEAKTLAVLPFVDISEEQDQAWYAYGLTEELINRLAQLEGLQVTGRTSSYHFEDRNEDLRQIAEALGVNHLLEGSVRTDDDKLRITAQLIEAQSGFHAWSRQFNRPRKDIFAVQQEIAEAVATVLSIELQVGSLGTRLGGTHSVEAYELVMLSKQYQWEATPESMLQAIDCVKRAIEIDPDYARAWLHLAGLYVNTYSIRYHLDEIDWMLLSQQSLDHARSLEPDLPDVKFMTMTIQYINWQWSGVEKTMDRGAGLEIGSDFDLLFGWTGFLLRVGRIREAIPLFERMRRLNPYSAGTARGLAWAYVIQGRSEEGLAEVERSFDTEGFKSRVVANGMRIVLSMQDRDLLGTWLARAEQYMPESRELIKAMSETLDDREAALAWLRDAFQRTEEHDFLIPPWAVWHGDVELALDAMQRLPVPSTFWGNEMKEIRRLPRFKNLVRQVGLEEYFREYGWNDFCHPLNSEDFECG
jgi:TolB-like protein/DNA-binding winged helix-turn-helix (wHTH) protein